MASSAISAATGLLNPVASEEPEKQNNGALVFDSDLLQKQPKMPDEFVWPSGDLARTQHEELNEPLVDLSGFMRGDEAAIVSAAELVRVACVKHGFFQVTNHGVDPELIRAAYDELDSIFKLPLHQKLGARRKPGSACGYSGAHADRYTSKLPWKEIFSFQYHHKNDGHNSEIVDYFKSVLGQELENTGRVYQKYCEAMKEVSFIIMELLAISLGMDRLYYRNFFEDGSSLMRCNYYPPCNSSSLTLGTGPHTDPVSLTILHQDQVGGLEVLSEGKWLAVRPRPDAFVVNIGDTFMALSNGRYKSCLHRALVHTEKERRSLVYFVSPRDDKTVRPPENLMEEEVEGRKYPDFKWSDLFDFTQKHYRADVATLESFILWLRSSQKSPN
ncbi:gibberellin 20 oxidase 2 [Neltuma alba]|uniref:gibberellin 20 oxidase 2 n=1 Tax=Neltuma alba TaxID=207710 RepID=UPI0010A4CA24|nr:gibberellin 20 oxidase 2-like [Prosopis alba]